MNCEIDLYDLFDAVTEDYFYCKAACRREYEQAKHALERVSVLLGFNVKRLIALHRFLFRWGRVRRWPQIFPMRDHYSAIVSYLAAEPPLREGGAA